MSLVRLQKVSKSYDGIPVLDDVDFRIEDGEKIGLIGRNGTGKTTLFRLITGQLEPTSGSIERMRRARIACLAQMPDLPPEETIHQAVMRSFEKLLQEEKRLRDLEHRLASGDQNVMEAYSRLQDTFRIHGGYEFRARARSVLFGLGFTEEEFDLPVTTLSGGQRTRLMLALILLQDADLILLDEPENHLDIAAREWLEGFLQESPKAFVIISHDRRSLDAVVKRIDELERGQIRSYTGDYSFYLQQKSLLREQHERAYLKQQEFIEKEQRWIERFRYKNTKASQVQSRIKRLEKIDRIDSPLPEGKAAGFRFGAVVRTGEVVIEARDIAMRYGPLVLYQGVSLEIKRGERIGIIGPNGCGKTTLLRHFAGRLPGAEGEVRLGHKVQLGYYEQHHENLSRELDIFQELRNVRTDWTPEQVRTYLGRFLFVGDEVFKPISALSGGELSRVALAKLIAREPNVLLLDEPTNHLDIASREALEEALAQYPGTLVMVSHDRTLIDKMADRLVVFEADGVITHLGNYTDYREQRERLAGEMEERNEDPLKIRRVERRKRDKDAERERRRRKKDLDELEACIEAMEQTIEDIEMQFTQADPADYAGQRKLKEEYEGLKADLASLYEEWEELTEELAQN
ncbi:MAG TPA: ABC-F family ATP-binding cassette domain-containing protein [Candidatus Hydrogenedentes bacterium]|jgi:ATP-binding cassette subfamily F protein 3|nr:ABC-F family ATP-binding cassette domain-containing protein [Candidatus Hydrogenedentota bacterium]